jgi:hypothetical protein
MSDTDIHIVKCNVLNAVQSQEIIALKERIIQLEEELMDAKNKYAALVADVVLHEDRGERIKRLEAAGDAMINEEWNKPRHVEQWRKAKEAKP